MPQAVGSPECSRGSATIWRSCAIPTDEVEAGDEQLIRDLVLDTCEGTPDTPFRCLGKRPVIMTPKLGRCLGSFRSRFQQSGAFRIAHALDAGQPLRLRWAGHVARMGESRNAYRVLVGRSEGKRPLGRPSRRWEDNIKMDLREVGYDDRDRINLAQDRDRWRAYVRAAMNLRASSTDRGASYVQRLACCVAMSVQAHGHSSFCVVHSGGTEMSEEGMSDRTFKPLNLLLWEESFLFAEKSGVPTCLVCGKSSACGLATLLWQSSLITTPLRDRNHQPWPRYGRPEPTNYGRALPKHTADMPKALIWENSPAGILISRLLLNLQQRR
ncbi:hypothetical protein ANN_26074 [Periplaneta americana]|uniref:Uncharacterized protein n=1 Tax=Periplaneta americana TaxID=6978 RepID=A0ABQ8S4X1_PERAM|nr:hypothetical protein ANN_26074 [Periplaneta americana]